MKKWSTKQLIEEHAERIKELKLQGFGRRKIAKIISEETEIPCTTGVMQLAIHKLNLNDNSPSNKMIVVEENPKEEIKIPIDDLIKSRIKAYSRKKSKFSKHYRTIKMECKPFGIWAVGDPHVDSDGCDWQTLLTISK